MAIDRIDVEVCNGCGVCVESCPVDVIRMAGDKAVITYPKDCVACYLCEMDCTNKAIYVTSELKFSVLPY